MAGKEVRTIRGAACLALLLLLPGCARFEARMALKRGNAAYKEGKYQKALDSYARVNQGVPERVAADLYTGFAHMAQYRFGSKHPKDREHADKAVAAYEEYLKTRPPDTRDTALTPPDKVEEWIVTLLADAEQYDRAVARLEQQLAAKQGKDPAILRALATTFDKWGRPTTSLEYYQRWAELFPGEAAPHTSIAAYCWNMSYRQSSTMDPVERNRWIDFGLAAADAALRIQPDQAEAVTYKNLLLRERAKMRIDPDQVAVLLREANVLLERAKELRKKQKEAEEEKAKAAASPSPKGGGPS